VTGSQAEDPFSLVSSTQVVFVEPTTRCGLTRAISLDQD